MTGTYTPSGTLCMACGKDHGQERCSAHSKRDNQRPCTMPRVPGTTVCRYHGGNAPQVRAHGALRVAEAEMRTAFGKLADHATPVDDPFTALAHVAGEVVAWKEFCAARIAELEELRTLDDKNAEQTHALIQLFERALDRCVSTLATIAKLNVEERMARVSERQAASVVRAVDAALDAAGVSGATADRAAAKAAAAHELRTA